MNAGSVREVCFALWLTAATSVADPVDPPEPLHADADVDAQLDFILDNPLSDSDYVSVQRCINSDTYRKVEVLDERHLLFLGRRGAVWLNQLRYACLGLRGDGVLVFQMRDRNVCDLDGFSSVPSSGGPSALGVRCMLGRFEEITEAQADVLRKALKARARTPALKKPPETREP